MPRASTIPAPDSLIDPEPFEADSADSNQTATLERPAAPTRMLASGENRAPRRSAEGSREPGRGLDLALAIAYLERDPLTGDRTECEPFESDIVDFAGLPHDDLDPLPFVVDEEHWIGGSGQAAESTDHFPPHPGRSRCTARVLNSMGAPEPASLVEGRLRDLSMSGLAFQASAEIPPGTALELRMIAGHSGTVVQAAGTVVRCEPSRKQGYQIVCRLNRYLTFAEIHEIGRDLFASSLV